MAAVSRQKIEAEIEKWETQRHAAVQTLEWHRQQMGHLTALMHQIDGAMLALKRLFEPVEMGNGTAEGLQGGVQVPRDVGAEEEQGCPERGTPEAKAASRDGSGPHQLEPAR